MIEWPIQHCSALVDVQPRRQLGVGDKIELNRVQKVLRSETVRGGFERFGVEIGQHQRREEDEGWLLLSQRGAKMINMHTVLEKYTVKLSEYFGVGVVLEGLHAFLRLEPNNQRLKRALKERKHGRLQQRAPVRIEHALAVETHAVAGENAHLPDKRYIVLEVQHRSGDIQSFFVRLDRNKTETKATI